MARSLSENKKILVALSGGVDSAMSVYYLQQAGWEVSAVYFKFLDNRAAEQSAEMLARKLKIKLVKKDLRQKFKKEIIGKFIKSYANNETPNPCVFCNSEFKFYYLLKVVAQDLKISKVATGHYVQIKKEKGRAYLLTGLDKIKDQSYFLYRLKQSQLKNIIFPLGDKKKSEIIEAAKRLGLNPKTKESQNACFLANEKNIQNFLLKNLPTQKGEIINEKGIVLGRHLGAFNFTLGQRKGLGISGGPYFVIGKKGNQLKVARNKQHIDIFHKKVIFKKVHWINKEPNLGEKYQAKIRYLSKNQDCRLIKLKKGRWQADFSSPVWAPARGQSLVIYQKNQIIGGGIID